MKMIFIYTTKYFNLFRTHIRTDLDYRVDYTKDIVLGVIEEGYEIILEAVEELEL